MSLISLRWKNSKSVDHLIRDARVAQGELERPAQGVDAIENGEIAGPGAARLGCRRRSGRRSPRPRPSAWRSSTSRTGAPGRVFGEKPFASAGRCGRSARRPPAESAACCDSFARAGRREPRENPARTRKCCSDSPRASRKSTGPGRRSPPNSDGRSTAPGRWRTGPSSCPDTHRRG